MSNATATTPENETRRVARHTPATDIYETPTSIELVLDMPGLRAGDVEVRVEEGILSVEGVTLLPEVTGTQPIGEFSAKRYARSFQLPSEVDDTKIDATLTDGTLRLRLAKAESAQPRVVKVKTN